MKKLTLSLLLVAGLHGAAHAQRGNPALGVKVGASLSGFAGEDTKSLENIFGFHTGLFANLSLSNHIAFQPELLYSQKGTKQPLNSPGFEKNYATYRFNYVDVPLAFHVNTNGFFVEAGPQVGFLLSAKSKVGNASTDIKNSYNSIDFGYLAGLGYQRKSGLGAGLRYNGAFTNIGKEYLQGTTTYQDRARNSVFQLYLTYSFGRR
ncbi:porin family protein [Hymenobacter arizonensis]|uniref:Outer membrane protein beta-barrel domain-containing protein n=1 Tax=Hymenobacter arizonensis TaxID=1227077 RepID=A0A1I5YBL1_HYMAR|nr:porin family protein [Hymenobacter arizonensis]SFQ41563.1 Outer membrane protein beta-barrel domain-containing protein [Hymenobacter arizonensis]